MPLIPGSLGHSDILSSSILCDKNTCQEHLCGKGGEIRYYLNDFDPHQRFNLAMLPWTVVYALTLGSLQCSMSGDETPRNRRTCPPYPLPQCPPGLPFVRNVIGINTNAPWQTYVEWVKEYGAQRCGRFRRVFMHRNPQATLFTHTFWEKTYSDRQFLFTSELWVTMVIISAPHENLPSDLLLRYFKGDARTAECANR
jgi:hypothetical protein